MNPCCKGTLFVRCELVCCRILAALSDSGACLSGFRASCLLISTSVDLTGINQWSTCQDLLCWTNSFQPLALSLSGPLSPELWRTGLIFQRPHISVKPLLHVQNSQSEDDNVWIPCPQIMSWVTRGRGMAGSTEPHGCHTSPELSMSGLSLLTWISLTEVCAFFHLRACMMLSTESGHSTSSVLK